MDTEDAVEATVVRPSTAPREPVGIKVQIPRELHQAIIRIQAEENLDFEPACLKAAMLLDSRGGEYKKAVLNEASGLSKSQFMKQLNKARKTIEDSAHQRGYSSGRDVGFNKGLQQFCYLCKDCGQTLYASPQNEWKWLVEHGYLSTWVHVNCPKRRT